MTAFVGSKVLITGGASGLGRLLALEAASRGARVALWDIAPDRLEAVAAEVGARGGQPALAMVCDVSDRAQVYARAAEVREAIGPVDIVINNAGVVSGARLLDLPDEKIERTFRINTLALFWVTKAFLPDMIRRNRGHVVTMASASGLLGVAKLTDYAASKFAAVGFDESLRVELRQVAPGVRTTVVCPYYINTGMFDGVRTRFPWLLPILEEQDVVDRIVRAVEADHRRVAMPWMVGLIPAFKLLPVPVFDSLADFFGVNVSMESFVGRKQPAPRPAADADAA